MTARSVRKTRQVEDETHQQTQAARCRSCAFLERVACALLFARTLSSPPLAIFGCFGCGGRARNKGTRLGCTERGCDCRERGRIAGAGRTVDDGRRGRETVSEAEKSWHRMERLQLEGMVGSAIGAGCGTRGRTGFRDVAGGRGRDRTRDWRRARVDDVGYCDREAAGGVAASCERKQVGWGCGHTRGHAVCGRRPRAGVSVWRVAEREARSYPRE